MKKRIWELDAFRGLCILGMVLVHLVYDLVELYGILQWTYPPIFSFLKNWGGVLFLLLSGTCATLGSRHLRRGLVVLGCAVLVTAVTGGMILLGFHPSILISFGVLHCLGLCMLLWEPLRRLSTPVLALIGLVLVFLGLYFRTITVACPFLFPLGLVHPDFFSSDYFPLLPNLGFFLLGACLGRILYKDKTTRFPRVDPSTPAVAFLSACGKASLPIYLLHQPILAGVCYLLTLMIR